MKQALCLCVLLAGTAFASRLDVDKASLAPDGAGRSFLSSSNGSVTVNLANLDSGTAGRFTIGTADGQRLLYGHGGDPWSTYVRLSVDGVVYAPAGDGVFDQYMTVVGDPVDNAGSLVIVWDAAGVQLTQTLTPDLIDGQGLVRIQYGIQNLSGEVRDVSLLLEMDTMVSDNDGAPISTSNGYISVETCYEGGMVPNTWQAFEEGPTQDPALLTGCGILNGFGATLPDFTAFGQWGNMYDAVFDYVCTGASYGDSGCLLRWDDPAMPAGATAAYQTFYGSCTGVVQVGELSLNVGGTSALSCVNGDISPNPFDVNVLVTNTGEETCHDVTATILPGNGLEGEELVWIGDLEPDQTGAAGFFLTVADGVYDVYGTFTVLVESADCPSNSFSREIWIPVCETVSADDRPLAFGLGNAWPNPFNPATTLSFTLPETEEVSLIVCNLAGERVATLVDSRMASGAHSVVFDASALPSGLYFAVLQSGERVESRKLLLTK